MDDVEFIIFVTGRFHWLKTAVTYFYGKYFDVPLTFFSDRPMDGVNAVEVFPRDMHIYNEPCGKRIKDALAQLDKPLVMFGYMDLLPIREVNLELVQVLANYMLDRGNIARGNLWAEIQERVRYYPIVFGQAGLSIHYISADDPHIAGIGSTHLIHALWSREFLLGFIEDGWTLAAVERDGPTKFRKQGHWTSIATYPGLVSLCHLCYTAAPNEVRLSTIEDAEDRAYVAQFVPGGYRIT